MNLERKEAPVDDEDLWDELEDLDLVDFVDDPDLDLDYCENCGQVGVLHLTLWECKKCARPFCEYCLNKGLCPACAG
jgi:hypothetical protein